MKKHEYLETISTEKEGSGREREAREQSKWALKHIADEFCDCEHGTSFSIFLHQAVELLNASTRGWYLFARFQANKFSEHRFCEFLSLALKMQGKMIMMMIWEARVIGLYRNPKTRRNVSHKEKYSGHCVAAARPTNSTTERLERWALEFLPSHVGVGVISILQTQN